MPNITTYATKATPIGADRLVGTDSADGSTKNFLVSALSGSSASWGDQQIRYVAKTGVDTNDGLSWATAKLTLAAAVASLPTEAAPVSVNYPTGTVYMGAGNFIETATPILIDANIRISGQGPQTQASGTTSGTTITLANASNHALIDYHPAFTDYAHHLILENILFEGNKANNTTMTDPLVRIYRGGFNCAIRNCQFNRATKQGLWLENSAVNVEVENCVWYQCGAEGLYLNQQQDGAMLIVDNTQFDACGAACIKIVDLGTAGTSGISHMVFRGIKAEGLDANTNPYVIEHVGRTAAGGAPQQITVIDMLANATGGGTVSVGSNAAIYEHSAGPADGADWVIINATVSNYGSLFSSTIKGIASIGTSTRYATFTSDEYYKTTQGYKPGLEIDGAGIYSGLAAPAFAAPVGSMYLRRDGGASTTLYIKESVGTSWRAV